MGCRAGFPYEQVVKVSDITALKKLNFELLRENGDIAELKWSANPEKGIADYRVYKLEGTWEIQLVVFNK